MELGSVAWFSGHPRPFLIREEYCTNPHCACNEIGLTLQEISDCGEKVPDPLSFRLRVDLATWQECDPPPRSAQVAECVQQFLTKCPAQKRAELRARHEQNKRTAKRLGEYKIDPLEMIEGKLFSFTNLLHERGALSSGGRGYTHRLLHQGREYLVEDHYCPNPACDCQEVHVEFWECETRQQGEQQHVAISQSLVGKVTLTGRREVVARGAGTAALAEEILSACWDRYHDDLPMLASRYRQVKEIGQRSLEAAAATDLEAKRTLPNNRPVEEVLGEGGPPSRARVGRNLPSPCGSGKKFKHCCWNRTNEDP